METKEKRPKNTFYQEHWAAVRRFFPFHERSNPAPDEIAWSSLSRSTFSLLYLGSWTKAYAVSVKTRVRTEVKLVFTFNRLTHVLDVGKRCSSLPASRIAKYGFNCLNPLCVPHQQPVNDQRTTGTTHSRGGRLQLVTKRKNARLCSWSKLSRT